MVSWPYLSFHILVIDLEGINLKHFYKHFFVVERNKHFFLLSIVWKSHFEVFLVFKQIEAPYHICQHKCDREHLLKKKVMVTKRKLFLAKEKTIFTLLIRSILISYLLQAQAPTFE